MTTAKLMNIQTEAELRQNTEKVTSILTGINERINKLTREKNQLELKRNDLNSYVQKKNILLQDKIKIKNELKKIGMIDTAKKRDQKIEDQYNLSFFLTNDLQIKKAVNRHKVLTRQLKTEEYITRHSRETLNSYLLQIERFLNAVPNVNGESIRINEEIRRVECQLNIEEINRVELLNIFKNKAKQTLPSKP